MMKLSFDIFSGRSHVDEGVLWLEVIEEDLEKACVRMNALAAVDATAEPGLGA